MNNIEKMSDLLRSMTYAEMMEFADAISSWTTSWEDKTTLDIEERLRDKHEIAELLSDWSYDNAA